MLADEVDFVVGVDTHVDQHALAVVEAATLQTCRQLAVVASRQGYRQALRLARRYAPGRRAWALEGSGCYGAGLARFLNARGEQVLEVERPAREGRQGRLKSDALDAERAARKVLAGSAGALPRLAPDTQALRALLSTREGAVTACTAALNELRALIVTSPPELRERLRGRSEAALLDACVRLRPGRSDTQRAAVALALRSLALRVRQLRSEARTLEKELARRVPDPRSRAPRQTGCRPDHRGSSPDRLVRTRPAPLRSRVRPTRRRSTDPRQLRQNRPPPTRPRRRPPPQPGPTHDRPHPPPPRPPNTGIHRPSRLRRKERTRSDPLPQALPRPLPLPTTGGDAADLL